MKKLLTFIMACVISLGVTAQISKEAFEKWHQNKYSMFIHFGLYSELGGVWEGSPVTRGYSEQIQSFAGIFSDWYGDTALRFNPTLFNADAIVSLAKEARCAPSSLPPSITTVSVCSVQPPPTIIHTMPPLANATL